MSKVVRVKFKPKQEIPEEILEQREANSKYHSRRQRSIEGMFNDINKLPTKKKRVILREKLRRRILPGSFGG